MSDDFRGAGTATKKTSSDIAGRPCDAKACQG